MASNQSDHLIPTTATAKSTKVEDAKWNQLQCYHLVYAIKFTNNIDIFTISLQKYLLAECFILLIVKKICLVH